MKKILILMLVALISNPGKAQISSFNKEADGVTFQVPGKAVKVFVCSDNIIRASLGAETAIKSRQSLVVTKQWNAPAFEVSETDTSVNIITEKLVVAVYKSNSAIGYFNKSGELIVKESTKALTAKTVSGVSTNTCTTIFNSPAKEAIYGLGQHQQSIMNYKGRMQVLEQANMEIALPIILSNKGYGILWDNYSRTTFDGAYQSSSKYKFESECGNLIDYYFFYGPEPDQIIAAYRTATGTAPLFPKWAYGLFQSMDKYEKSSDLFNVGIKYRKSRIPLDCIVQDWDYWTPNAWGSHMMNQSNYPDPKLLIDSLHNMNFHAMISVWPLFTEGDGNYNELNAIGAIYPSSGKRHYYDPHNEEARNIYWRQVKENLFGKYGWDAWWADGDEPDNWPDSYDRRTANTALGKGFLYYNTYPLMHTSGFYEGWRSDIPEKRLFTLSRSAFLGQQRNAAASWSGDIKSDWTDFKKQLSAGLNFSLSGIPYWTTDIGGYWGTDWTLQENRELFTRWFEYGTFCPLFRIHGKQERTLFSETSWDAVTRTTLLKYDKLRYRLMPYIYSMAWKVTTENYTLMRHLIMDYRTDPNVVNIDNQFMFGSDMMICPVADKGATSRQVYFPSGKWFDFWTGKMIEGEQKISVDVPPDKIPVYVKSGSILPMGPEIEYANQANDPLELRIYSGANASFNIYDDEGDSYNYEQGQHSTISLVYNNSAQQLTIGTRVGSYEKMLKERTFKIILVDEAYGIGGDIPVSFDTIVTYAGSEMFVQLNAKKLHVKTHFEAEDASLFGGIKKGTTNKGFSGTGYVQGLENSANSSTEFHVTIPNPGNYIVKLRYSAAKPAANKSLTLSVNNLQSTGLNCENTVNWNSWNTLSYIVYFKAGENSLSYKADSASVILDCIDITVPPSPAPFNDAVKKNVRLRLQNSNLYLDEQSNVLTLKDKSTSSNNQIWVIEKVNNGSFKITSMTGKESLTIKDGALENDASVVLADYSATANQQWLIDDFGYGLWRISAKHSRKCMEAESADSLVQDTDEDLDYQRWIMEDAAIPGNGNGLLGEYYKGQNFSTLSLSRIDEKINFNWGLGSPDASIPTDNYSIRWTGQIMPQYTDEYTFYTKSDDGVKLWVNDIIVISDWTARALTERSGKIKLEGNKLYNIRLDYFDNQYDAIVSLEWASPTLERELVPKSQLFGKLLNTGLGMHPNNGLEFSIFPNPANSMVTVDFQLTNTTDVEIELYNMHGTRLKSIQQNFAPGFHQFNLHAEGLSSGNYIVKVISGETTSSKILIWK